ncbi:MAG: DNA polymerase III subunit gamma/tau [Anaerolineae bacterium]
MAAQALYLKYRPQTFEEVAGQEAITRTLRNALRQGRIRHAYLFTGPRGTGKTTTARLLAKAVNCQAPEGERPCNACALCVAINEGRLLDLIEIDAASNRGIDEIRDIREKVGFRPSQGQYKVYVLDEAHMLTEPAFNALLKTLEEPPPHVIFTLVTTDPHKIPATIASRCQRFDFRRIRLQVIVERLAYIAEQEGVTVEPAALELIAHHGTGAMRDAISLLDQLTSYGEEITLAQVQMVLGTMSSESAAKLVVHLADGDVAAGLDLINRAVGDGADPRQFGREVVEYLRGLLLVREGAGGRLINATAEQAAEMEAVAERMTVGQLLRTLGLFTRAVTDLKRGFQIIPQLPLEMALVESILDPEAAQTPGPADGPAPSTPSPPRSEGQRVAEQAPGAHSDTGAVTPASRSAKPVKEEPAPTLQSPAEAEAQSGELTLAQVERIWDQVLQAVRQRNPAAEGALRSGCKPVEVRGDEIVVTFPYVFLRDKLGDPQRKAEIQDALTEVLQARCRLKLVLATEYVPRQQTNPAPPAAQSGPSGADAETGEEQVPEAISRWAEEHGGEAKFVPS